MPFRNRVHILRILSIIILAAAAGGCEDGRSSGPTHPHASAAALKRCRDSNPEFVNVVSGKRSQFLDTREVAKSGPFAIPAKPKWLSTGAYCSLISNALMGAPNNRLTMRTLDSSNTEQTFELNAVSTGIYGYSVLPAYEVGTSKEVGYFLSSAGPLMDRSNLGGGTRSDVIAELRKRDPKSAIATEKWVMGCAQDKKCDDAGQALAASNQADELGAVIPPVS